MEYGLRVHNSIEDCLESFSLTKEMRGKKMDAVGESEGKKVVEEETGC